MAQGPVEERGSGPLGPSGEGAAAPVAGEEALELPAGLRQAMWEHALRQRPLEACGLVAGRDGRPVRFYPARNAAASPVRYELDPQDLLRITLDIEGRGEELWGIFHSHPQTPAYPSATDIRLAFYPSAYYLIASLVDPAQPVLRAFTIRDGAIREWPLRIIP